MWVLLGCSLMTLAIFAERLLYFHRATINVGDFLHGIANLLRKKNYAEALHECAGTPGPVARVIHAAIIHHDHPRSELKDIVTETGQFEVPKLERYLPALYTISYVAPLIGLLGTAIGMIDSFVTLTEERGFTTASELSEGIYVSLLTTAAGIAVGIIAYVLYQHLFSIMKNLMHDMERGGIEGVNLLVESKLRTEIIEFESPRRREEAKVREEEEEAAAAAAPKKGTRRRRRGSSR